LEVILGSNNSDHVEDVDHNEYDSQVCKHTLQQEQSSTNFREDIHALVENYSELLFHEFEPHGDSRHDRFSSFL